MRTYQRVFWAISAIAIFSAVSTSAAYAQAVTVPNPSFEEGTGAPASWQLSGGPGAWADDAADGAHAITVTGAGKTGDSNYWRSETLPFEPFTVYRLQFSARSVDGSGGCPISGPVFCNRDLGALPSQWAEYTSVFITPSIIDPGEQWLRFGQWEVSGTVAYDNVRLTKAQPVYRSQDGIVLGDGESVNVAEYTFKAPLNGSSCNHARPLAYQQCSYNAPRWVFGASSVVVYRHEIGDANQTAAQVEFAVNYYTGGELLAEVSADGETWTELGTAAEIKTFAFDIPSTLLPAKAVWVRLSSRAQQKVGQNSDPGSLQVNAYIYRATLDRKVGEFKGMTTFVATPETDPVVKVSLESFGDGIPGGDNTIVLSIDNPTGKELKAQPTVDLTTSNGNTLHTALYQSIQPGQQTLRMPYRIPGTGEIHVAFRLGGEVSYHAETTFTVSDLHNCDYGELLPGSTDDVGLWWTSSGWKISQTRPMPGVKGAVLQLYAAKNEVEAAQFVVRPNTPLTNFAVQSQPLEGPGTIPAENIELLRVRYVPVTEPTDKVGTVAPWPDPIPPFNGPLKLDANKNLPVWVRVKVPADAAAGSYKGVIKLSADGYSAEVPIQVQVFNFALPDRMSCTSAYGFNPSRVFSYHNLTDPEQQRQVFDKYLATLSAHHISPYGPTLDAFQVSWPGLDQWDGVVRDETVKHGGQSSLVLLDDSDKKSASALYDELVPIPAKGIRIQFWYKTGAPGHPFLVTLMHHDGGGQWMFGRNTDIHIEGNGDWQQFDQTVAQFPEGAAAFKLRLWAALFAEDDSTTGTVWYDDLRVTDAETSAVLIAGDFEPADTSSPDALKPSIDWTAWDAGMTRAIDELHFNTFSLPIPGLGGGTFHARFEPNLLGYGEDTLQYKTAFTNYCQAVQEHLREKGWLDEAFVYWFDEPDPKDYEFVMNGFRKIKEAAPDINRMLTEQPEPELYGGPNIWCPLTPEWDNNLAEQRRDAGDKFWWYICTGPKEPYATLFIDHPGTELRVWMWQTWERRINGTLIWETNYWTSEAAYPDPAHPQNPYEDPMGWVTGYSTPPGTKMQWGNGDGRFLYPPEAAADGRPAQPVLDGPVDSIRLEMLRDGIEDYEYLNILSQLITANWEKMSQKKREHYVEFLKVPEDVSKDLTHFTKDPKPIEDRRTEVAAAIEQLSAMK